MSNYKNVDIMISMSESDMAKKIYGNFFKLKKLTDIVRTINPQKLFKSKEILFLKENHLFPMLIIRMTTWGMVLWQLVL